MSWRGHCIICATPLRIDAVRRWESLVIKTKFLGLAAAAAACIGALPAYACGTAGTTVTCQGVSYTLLETGNSTTDDFTLNITGINTASDTKGGRTGVQAFAFTNPAGFLWSDATPPSGFVPKDEGLSSAGAGCHGSGNFFCFNASPSAFPVTGSTLSFRFTLTAATAGDLSSWNPDFKIQWVGSANNYDLVSQTLTPTPAKAPEIDPASATAALTFLAGGLAMVRGRRRRA